MTGHNVEHKIPFGWVERLGLHLHGIQTERADFRVHVGYATMRLYMFDPLAALEAIANGSYKIRPAFQTVDGRRVTTGLGWLVPPDDITFLRVYFLGEHMPPVPREMHERGRAAENVVATAIKNRVVPLPIDVQYEFDTGEQIDGGDIRVTMDYTIQVKCDVNAGWKEHGGSGYLFLQFAEINPNGIFV